MPTLTTKAYAAKNASSPLAPFQIERREPGPKEVLIEVQYCGICHSDIHQVRDEWGGSLFPMVPGHEIVGRVTRAGNQVSRFKVGDTVGVGCLVGSCQECPSCRTGDEQYCDNGFIGTYNAVEKDGKTPTYGGYSTQMTVDQDFVLKIPENLDPAAAAPLLCAGITTYSPLKHWNVGPGKKVGIIGLGGLGHMGVKIAASMGAEVTVFSTSSAKEVDARKMGARHFVISSKPEAMTALHGKFDFLLSTISASYDINAYIALLSREGTLVTVGVPSKPPELNLAGLIFKRRQVAGSLIGGIKETQEMLDYCGKNNITSDIEMINIQDVNAAYERTLRADVKYRFVIDMKSLR